VPIHEFAQSSEFYYSASIQKRHQFKICGEDASYWDYAPPFELIGYKPWPPAAATVTAQGIGGARSGRISGGTPGKPGFLRSKKCAQLYLLILYNFRRFQIRQNKGFSNSLFIRIQIY
jgi:hypothetical protein